MNLPKGVTHHPRQPELIQRNLPAVIQIEDRGRFYNNRAYSFKDHLCGDELEPCLHGDWARFDRACGIGQDARLFSRATHGSKNYPPVEQLPDILVVPNLPTRFSDDPAEGLWVFGCTLGQYHPARSNDHLVQEVYEFQTTGLLALDREEGEIELWVARDGDKVAVPAGSHVTLYNLGNQSHPLIALNFYGLPPHPGEQSLVRQHGPLLLAYYSQTEVVFQLNRRYLNNRGHDAGVNRASVRDEERTISITRQARLDLDEMLYEQLTQNLDLVARFAAIGIHIKPASPEAALEFQAGNHSERLFFSLPLVEAASKGSPVYRYFFPEAEAARPAPPRESTTAIEIDPLIQPHPLNRPLMVVVEGIGEWVEKAYRPIFKQKAGNGRRLKVFYTGDSRWKEPPAWVSDESAADGLEPWETYLDKKDAAAFDRYQKLRPDAVFIVTPDFTHSFLARRWLDKTPTVCVEKPFDSQVKNVDELRRAFKDHSLTEVLGLDHYLFYALPLRRLKPTIDQHLGGAIESVEFYLTERNPIEAGRELTLQHGLTLDLLPHMLALLAYFGDIGTVDDIVVSAAGRYQPLVSQDKQGQQRDIATRFHAETYSRVQFSFQERSGSGFHIPCTAVVGKGFEDDVKYLQITGRNGHAIRVDFKSRPNDGDPGYPWNSIFFLQGKRGEAFPSEAVRVVEDPYRRDQPLTILTSPQLHCELSRARYEELLDDMLEGTAKSARSTLTLTQGQTLVRALDRIWWAIQAARPDWRDFILQKQSPFAPVAEPPAGVASRHRRHRLPVGGGDHLIRPIRALGVLQVYDARESEDRRQKPPPTRGRLDKPREPAEQPLSRQSLGRLIEQLRAQNNGLSLTLLIHGWRSNAAEIFINQLARNLEQDDVLWLISPETTPSDQRMLNEEKFQGLPWTIALDLDDRLDRRIYRNLIGDLVFFPAFAPGEVDQVAAWKGRARSVVINNRRECREQLQRTAETARLPVYLWGETELSPSDDSRPLQAPVNEIDEIGRFLSEKTSDLSEQENRRAKFLACIEETINLLAHGHDWGRQLALQADIHNWPPWAVECLPRLYISMSDSSEAGRRAWVWQRLLDWLPASLPVTIGKAWGSGQLIEIVAPPEASALLNAFAEKVEANRRELPLSSEYSFKVVVHESMREIGQSLIEPAYRAYLPAFNEKLDQLYQELVGSR